MQYIKNHRPVSVGYIDGVKDITLYSGFPLSVKEKSFDVYVWLDGELANNSYLGVSFDGDIHLDAEQTEEDCPSDEAYAIYSADDNSLRFYRSETPIEVGSTYNGLTATAVYTGFENEDYEDETFVPWYEYSYDVVSIVTVEDYIYPVSTAYWFTDSGANIFDLAKLNTSRVVNMESMFLYASFDDSITTISGLENWDTSNVTDMSYMFNYVGNNSATFNISDLSDWDTSQVTDMYGMFENTGYGASNWSLDLSGWNVCNVTRYDDFNTNVTDKIDEPSWGMACPS